MWRVAKNSNKILASAENQNVSIIVIIMIIIAFFGKAFSNAITLTLLHVSTVCVTLLLYTFTITTAADGMFRNMTVLSRFPKKG